MTRERYAECRAVLFERSGPSTELQSFEVVDVTDDAVPIAGIPEQSSKAVTAQITIGVNGDSRASLDTMHAVHVDGPLDLGVPGGRLSRVRLRLEPRPEQRASATRSSDAWRGFSRRR